MQDNLNYFYILSKDTTSKECIVDSFRLSGTEEQSDPFSAVSTECK